jgi:hypothetical protein
MTLKNEPWGGADQPIAIPIATESQTPAPAGAGPLAPSTIPASGQLFTATRSLLALEHFRTPYAVSGEPGCVGFSTLRARAGGPALLWPSSATAGGDPVAAVIDQQPRSPIPVFARIISDRQARAALSEYGDGWSRFGTVVTSGGEPLGALWRHEDGSVFLPFDPDEVQLALLSEQYHEILQGRLTRDCRRAAIRGYYRARGLMPRPAQIWLRRRYAPIQAGAPFPRWPIEPALHDFLDFLHSILESIAGEPVPSIAPWPDAKRWALVLTHDIETRRGVAAMDPVLAMELSLGLKSCWNFVPRRYEVTDDQIDRLLASGCEVGVHGLYHDGRDLDPAMLPERLPGMRQAADRWRATGFRSPATHRSWDSMPLLGFDYDSSYPDTDPFEPQAGGCCTWLPFFNRGMIELPMTMPQDHTLFVILRHRDEQAWAQKAQFLRSRGGMALLDTHPDYLTDPVILGSYRRFLERFAPDPDAWLALPGEVSSWWRRRAESELVRVGDGWTITGPASGEAAIEFRSRDLPTEAS